MSHSVSSSQASSTRKMPALGRDLAQLGLGTFRQNALADVTGFPLLDRFVELGGDLVDTAAMYGDGQSELVIGRWMRSAGARGRVVLVVKGGYPAKDGASRLNPKTLQEELEGSLERLGTDRIDVYMPHADDPEIPVGEIVDCLDEMVTSGLVTAVGASNWSIGRLGEAAVYAAVHGRASFCCSSVQWSLAERAAPYLSMNIGARDAASASWYARTGLPVLAWSALAAGFLGRPDVGGSPGQPPGPYDSSENRERRLRAAVLGRELGYSAAQVALAWVMHQKAQPFVLVGPGTVEHLDELWGASKLPLTPGQMSWLDHGTRA